MPAALHRTRHAAVRARHRAAQVMFLDGGSRAYACATGGRAALACAVFLRLIRDPSLAERSVARRGETAELRPDRRAGRSSSARGAARRALTRKNFLFAGAERPISRRRTIPEASRRGRRKPIR